jgi:transcription termination factor Rho
VVSQLQKSELEGKVLPELQRIAESLGMSGHQRMKKSALIDAILERSAEGGNGASASAPSGARRGGQQSAAAGNGEVSGSEAQAEAEALPDGPSSSEPTPGVADPTPEAAAEASARGELTVPETAPSEAPSTDGERREDRQPGGGREGQREGGPREGQREFQSQREGGPRDFQAGNRNRRLSREERRRQREEHRQKEVEAREEEVANAPVKTGILDILPEGYGFLRTSGYLPGPGDVYVSLSQVRRFGLRRGDEVTGAVRSPRDNEKYPALLRVDTVAGTDPDTARQRPDFDKLTPLFPDERYRLEHDPKGIAERIIDLVAPIGKGQRGMVVSPPKAGKTTVLKQIAGGILASDPNAHVIILLVDERPEEVTDWQRTVDAAEVVYSTFDKPADQHTQVTELVLERAKRLTEKGMNVVIILDSITRLARAYNLAAPASGRILSGGVDSTALYPPKRFFGTARNLEEGGSLAIIASALVETGSRMDEVIFEEFKGTGNWEIRLDRSLSEKRMFPALNIEASGTRKEERLMATEELALAWRLRRVLHALDSAASLELLIDKMRQTKSNEQFLREISKAPVGS